MTLLCHQNQCHGEKRDSEKSDIRTLDTCGSTSDIFGQNIDRVFLQRRQACEVMSSPLAAQESIEMNTEASLLEPRRGSHYS